MTKFKKIDEDTFEKTDLTQRRVIISKKELERSKKLLEKEIADRQSKLAQIKENLDGINKLKK